MGPLDIFGDDGDLYRTTSEQTGLSIDEVRRVLHAYQAALEARLWAVFRQQYAASEATRSEEDTDLDERLDGEAVLLLSDAVPDESEENLRELAQASREALEISRHTPASYLTSIDTGLGSRRPIDVARKYGLGIVWQLVEDMRNGVYG